MTDNNSNQPQQTAPVRRRKPLWPWVLLLVLTLSAIYTYAQITQIIETIRHEVPPEFWDVLEWMLRQGGLLPDNGRQAPDFAMGLADFYGMSAFQPVLTA